MIHFKTLSEELELERFPFDRRCLTLRMCIRTKYWLYNIVFTVFLVVVLRQSLLP